MIRPPPLFTLAGVANAGEYSGVLDIWMSELDGEVIAGDAKLNVGPVPVPSLVNMLASCPGLTGGIWSEAEVAPVKVGFCVARDGEGLVIHCSLGLAPPEWPELDLVWS